MRLLFLLLLFANNSFSGVGVTLSGKVTDFTTGKPLQNANIYVSDLKLGTSTNALGEYAIKNISEGEHLIEISHIGYSTHAEKITVKGNTVINFPLQEAVVENNTVVITGVSKATKLKSMPMQVAVVNSSDLFTRSSTNIIEALTRQTGVSSSSSSPAISKPIIRGLGYNRVLTIGDGVRQEGQQWGDEHGIEIDESSVGKVEILKGPASLMYGSDAMAGVINIITNVPLPSNTLRANVGADYQTNSSLRHIYTNIGANHNGFNWSVNGSLKAAADYRNKYDGYVFNSKFRQENFGGRIGYNGAWGYSHLLLSNFHLKAGLTEGERDDEGRFLKLLPGGAEVPATLADNKSLVPFMPHQNIRHFKVSSDNSFNVGQNRLTANLGWQQNSREEFGNPDDVSERELYFQLGTFTYASQFNFKDRNGFSPSIGVSGMLQNNSNKGVEQLIPNYSLNDFGIFLYSQKQLKKANFSGGLRWDARSLTAKDLLDGTDVKSPGFKKNFSNISASIGAAVQADSNVVLKFNIARAYRAPSLPELASNGSHEGTLRYEYGDNNLKSETSLQADASAEISNEHFSLKLAGYRNNINNFIFYRKLESVAGGDSTVDVNGESLTAFKFAQRNASLTGAEISFDLHPHPIHWFHFENTFSIVAGRFAEALEGSKYIPFMPAPKINTELRADIKTAGSFLHNAFLKFEMENFFKQDKIFAPYNTETVTPGYTLLNAGVGTDVVNKNGDVLFTISIAAQNITDKAYQNHLSRLKYAPENPKTGRMGVFNQGRNFSFKINVPFTNKW